jgi:hypothetical protein
MRATTLRRWAYRISAVLGLAYAVYVVGSSCPAPPPAARSAMSASSCSCWPA